VSWAKYVLIVLYVLNVLFTVGQIGKERKPVTPEVAVLTILWSGLFVWLVVIA
jgi:hypothetical protein